MDQLTNKTQGAPDPRHKTVAVDVGGVLVGGGAPIVVQSMTNTDTADVEGTTRQVAALARAGLGAARSVSGCGSGGGRRAPGMTSFLPGWIGSERRSALARHSSSSETL